MLPMIDKVQVRFIRTDDDVFLVYEKIQVPESFHRTNLLRFQI